MLVSWYAPALLAAVLLPYLPRNARGAEGTPQERVEQMQREMNAKLTQLLNEMAELRGRVERMETANARAAESSELRSRLDTLSRDLRDLREEMRASPRPQTSLYIPRGSNPSTSNFPTIPPTGEVVPPAAASGTLHLINDYPFTQQVIVNGQSYLLAPGRERRITIPAGEFEYQVVGADVVPRVRSLAAGVTHYARIHP